MSSDDCPICFDETKGKCILKGPCGHEICLACFERIRLNSVPRCPMCRSNYPMPAPPPPPLRAPTVLEPPEPNVLTLPLRIVTHDAASPPTNVLTNTLLEARSPVYISAFRRQNIRFIRHHSDPPTPTLDDILDRDDEATRNFIEEGRYMTDDDEPPLVLEDNADHQSS